MKTRRDFSKFDYREIREIWDNRNKIEFGDKRKFRKRF